LSEIIFEYKPANVKELFISGVAELCFLGSKWSNPVPGRDRKYVEVCPGAAAARAAGSVRADVSVALGNIQFLFEII
jgi:hypothetical protein